MADMTDISSMAAAIGLSGGTGLLGSALYVELMTSIIARPKSKLTDRIITVAAGSPVTEIPPEMKEAAARLRVAAAETVQLRSHDGLLLRGHWYPAEDAIRTVLCVHGWHSRWDTEFAYIAPFLHENKCNLLLIEQRCHGESEGDYITYGIRERYDVLLWLNRMARRCPAMPIYLFGVSMGASTSLMPAGFPIAHRVAGIIADCGYTTPRAIVRKTLEQAIGAMAGPTLAAVNANCRLKDCFSLDDYTALEAMQQNTRIPCLFIHGDADRLVPAYMGVENFKACRAPKHMLLVRGADHSMSFAVAPEAYRRNVLAFFEACDSPCLSADSHQQEVSETA